MIFLGGGVSVRRWRDSVSETVNSRERWRSVPPPPDPAHPSHPSRWDRGSRQSMCPTSGHGLEGLHKSKFMWKTLLAIC
jgi:hypothetical protein